MNLNLTVFGFILKPSVRRRMERQAHSLRSVCEITSAHILLGWHRETKPAYEAQVLLEVAGPDLYSVARDHTPEAAMNKAMGGLERKIHSRKRSQLKGCKRKGQIVPSPYCRRMSLSGRNK